MESNAIAIFSTILGVILTVIVTHFYDDRKEKRRLKKQKESVAISFYNEIKDIEQMFKPLIGEYKKYKRIDKHGALTYGHIGSLEQMIEFAKLDLNEYSSIYPDNSSYSQYKKEIDFFYGDIRENISQFYNSLLEADKEFEFYMKLRSHYDNKSRLKAIEIEYKFISHLLKANEEVPKLLEYFGKYKQNSCFM